MTGRHAAPEWSIVMPCLDEAQTIALCVRQARAFLDRHGLRGEIVVADNGSTDGSPEVASRAGARVIHVDARGYGAAVQAAIEAARGRFVIMGDADATYDFGRLMPFVEGLRAGADLVMGDRFAGGIRPGAMPWKNRYIGNPVLSAIGRLFFHSSPRDFHCGLRAFSKEAWRRMDLQTTGMEYASEMVIKATLLGLRIVDVPTTLGVEDPRRRSHLRPWRDGWRHLRFMLLFSPRWLFLYPGLALMAAGVIVGGWLLPGPRRIGAIELDVHTLVYCAIAVLIGFQAVCFAVLANRFAVGEGLLPPSSRLDLPYRRATLETGLAAGGALIVSGLAASIGAVWWWRSRSFGPLDPRQTLRAVIPAAVALTLGCQIVLSAFFLSVLGLRVRDRSAAGEPEPSYAIRARSTR